MHEDFTYTAHPNPMMATRRVLALVDPERNLRIFSGQVAEARRVRASAFSSIEKEEAAATEMLDGGVTDDGTAVIRCFGSIAEAPAWMALWCGIVSPSRLATVFDRYRSDPRVKQVWLMLDSPGGETAGVDVLAQQISDFPHPVHAIIGSECCSAAYWLASQCESISAHRSATVGACGVFCVLWDDTEELAKLGLKTHLITTGPLKGAGAPGQPWTDAQMANYGQYVNDIFALFQGAVLTHRKVSDDVWDGGIYTAATGLKHGLVDILI